ncbi:AsnC family transcriptional regulator [Candidatus Heimdallarchaeota archaeon B3_Heim]|nr:MAG: AsnC family transcriptional regulator [Candidatus Heimdallarchaeota archaeon B3_Heim]
MVDAIILLCVMPGTEQTVKKQVLELDEIKNCKITFGEYDLFIEVKAKNVKSLGSFVTKEIRKVPGVTKSITLIISESLEDNS